MPGVLDVVGSSLDFFFGTVVELNFESVHGFLPFLWDIGDLDVGLEGMSELHNLLLEHLTSFGMLEVLGGGLNLVESLGGEEFIVGSIVLSSPMSFLEVLVVVLNIIDLFVELVPGVVVEVDSGAGLFNIVLEDSADILPLFDELLTRFRFDEFLVKLVNFHGSI